MNDDKIISNYLDNLKKELNINEPETDTSLNTDTCEPDETPVPVSRQPYQPESADNYETFVFGNNTDISIAQSIINLYSELPRCLNKRVKIPGYSAYACTRFDKNYNAYLCTTDSNGQFKPFANIKFENSEFVVYQNNQRTGTLYGNDNESVWQFVPNGMPVPSQSPSTFNTVYLTILNTVTSLTTYHTNKPLKSLIQQQETIRSVILTSTLRLQQLTLKIIMMK